MTLKKQTRLSSPVFDTTPKPAGTKSFLTRRLISLSGRPLLAEKHLPIKPSTSEISQKCYSISVSRLYKFGSISDQVRQFKPAFQFVSEESIAFENHPTLLFATPKYAWVRPIIDFISPERISINNCPALIRLSDTVHPPEVLLEYPSKPLNSWKNVVNEKLYQTRLTSVNLISNSEIRMRQIYAAIEAGNVTTTISPANQGDLQKTFRINRFPIKNVTLASFRNFRSDNYNFIPYGFSTKIAPVKLHEIKVTVEKTEPKYNTATAIRLQRFKTHFQQTPEKFAPANEINGTFVLESKICFKAACNNHLGQPRKIYEPKLDCSHLNRAQPALEQSTVLHWPVKPNNPPLLAIAKIITDNRQILTLNATLQIQKLSSKRQPECIFDNSAHFAGHPSKMRLKLRLSRQQFTFREFAIKPQIARSTTPIDHISRPFIAAGFLPLKRAVKWAQTFKIRCCDASFFAPQNYLQKRSHFFIKSALHARYTLRSLRKLYFSETFERTKSLKLITKNWKLLGRAIKPTLPVSFPVKKLKLKPLLGKFFFKPIYFKMFASRPVFADIQLPLQKRRIKTTTGSFSANLHCEQLKRRKKSLRMLRFKLQVINDGFQNKPDRLLRRLTCQQRPFTLVLFAEKPAKFTALEKLTTRIREKPLQSVSQILLKKAAVRQKISVHLQVMLPVASMQVKTDSPSTLSQKSFIVPSLLKPSGKAFNCKLRLLPHPFGFPDFKLLPPRFDCLLSPVRFAAADIPAKMTNLPGHFILGREKVYLPPTSMKNPRKLLYKSVSQANMPREFYVSHIADRTSELDSPSVIKSFNYPWKTPATKNTVKADFAFKQSNSNRQKSIVLIAKRLLESPALYLDAPFGVPVFKMPAIKRLLLRARRFVAARNQLEPRLNAVLSRGRTIFRHGQTDNVRSAFSKCEQAFSLFRINDSFFSQNFLSDKPVPVYEKSFYRARFRALRFPYRPEIAALKSSAENFCITEQFLPSQGCDFAEESRASEFAFQMPGIGWSLPSSTNAIDLKPAETAVNNFDMVKLVPYSPGFVNKEEFALPKLDDFTPNLYHCINPDTFFKFCEKTGMRLKKAVRSYSFKHQAKSRTMVPPIAEFSNFGLKNAPIRTLAMDSLHWIILLRSYINIDSPLFNFISEPIAQIEPASFACHSASAQKPYRSCDIQPMIFKRLITQKITKKNLSIRVESCENIIPNLYLSIAGRKMQRDCIFAQQISIAHSMANFSVPIFHALDNVKLAKISAKQLYLKKSESSKLLENPGILMISEQVAQAESIMLPTSVPKSSELFRHANMPDWIDLMSLTCARKDIRIP